MAMDSLPALLLPMLCTLCIPLLATFWLYNRIKQNKYTNSIAFFHTNCDSGGGGERVLWCMVQHILESAEAANTTTAVPNTHPLHLPNTPIHTTQVAIYFRDTKAARAAAAYTDAPSSYCIPLISTSPLITDIQKRFKIDLRPSLPTKCSTGDDSNAAPLVLVPLTTAFLLDSKHYRFASLFAQSVASMIVCAEALVKYCPTHWVDTVGCAFTLPIAKYIAQCHTCAYIHYPLVNMDALLKADEADEEKVGIVKLLLKGCYKLVRQMYYHGLATLYCFAGTRADVSVTNSSWTHRHMRTLWKQDCKVVYPPVDLSGFSATDNPIKRENAIISVAQFRPEKRHALQLDIIETLLDSHYETLPKDVQFYICGSTRGPADEALVNTLKQRCSESTTLSKHAKFCVNISMNELVAMEQKCKVALHTMVEEHFGISVVEFVAAGLVTVADNSGGPKQDILRPLEDGRTVGYLVNSVEEFVDALHEALTMYDSEKLANMRDAAKVSLQRYCDNKSFGRECCNIMGLTK